MSEIFQTLDVSDLDQTDFSSLFSHQRRYSSIFLVMKILLRLSKPFLRHQHRYRNFSRSIRSSRHQSNQQVQFHLQQT